MAVEKIRAQFDFSNTPGNTPNRGLLDGGAAIQQADGVLFTRRADGSLRETDLRPMAEQIAQGPLALALGGKADATATAQALGLKANAVDVASQMAAMQQTIDTLSGRLAAALNPDNTAWMTP